MMPLVLNNKIQTYMQVEHIWRYEDISLTLLAGTFVPLAVI